MRPMSASSPRPRALRPRLSALGLALVCTVGLAAPDVLGPTSLASQSTGVVQLSAKGDPNKAKKKVDKQVDALKDHLDDLSASLKNAYLALRRTQAAIPVAQAALDKATAAQQRADQYNDQMAVELQVAQANEARAVDDLAKTRTAVTDSRTRVARFASQLYQDQGMGQLSVALSATSPEDFANRIAMTDTVMDVQHQELGRLATSQAAATAQEAHLTALRVQTQAAKDAAEKALAKAKTDLDALAVRQKAQSAALETQKAAEKKKLAAAEKEQARLQKVLVARAKAAKAAAARRAAALRKAHKKVPTGPMTSHGFLSRPSGGWISSEFGMRYHPILHYWRLHAGRDFAADCGTPIRAAASGTIISAGWAGGYGRRTEIDHGIIRGVDLVTAYNHMSRFAVTGGHVSRGQVIGYVGTTGESTGCHLHFETYEDGIPKDPRRWL
jgi:murein DD-endopeptidase MepM/ murein hydrolase activator NlpD